MDVLARSDILHITAGDGERGQGGAERGWCGEGLGHVARKVDELRYYRFGDDLRLSHRIRAFAAGIPGRHRRCVERVWGPA